MFHFLCVLYRYLINNIKLTRKCGLSLAKQGEAEKVGGEVIGDVCLIF
jgi:hypothetical protein